jgi:ATP-dependent Lon protease
LSCKTRVKKRYPVKVRFDLDQQQREYFLQQQMKTIQEELGGNTQEEEIDEMLVKAKDKKTKSI